MGQEEKWEQRVKLGWETSQSPPHRLGTTLPPTPAKVGTLLLLGIIHADLKDRRTLAAQKGDSRGCASCAPFQAVDTATPVLGPEEVVAMVTQAKCVVQLRTLIYNLEVEGMFLRSWGDKWGCLRVAQGDKWYLCLGPCRCFAISLGALANMGDSFAYSEMPEPDPTGNAARMPMARLSILSSLRLIHTHLNPPTPRTLLSR